MTSPLTNPQSYDVFTLDGKASPGLSRIKGGGNRAEEWQDQRAPGFAGAFTVFRGEQLTKISYDLELWMPEHFAAWDQWIAMLSEGKDRRPNPRLYTLVDLRTAHNKVVTVSYAEVSAMLNPSPGKWVYSVDLKEVKKREPIGGPILGPRDPNEKAIVDATAKRDALAAQRDAAFAAARAKK